jgi:hypothetical protein
MRRKTPVPFGKGPTEKDPNHGHLAGGLLHSEGGPAGQPAGPTRRGGYGDWRLAIYVQPTFDAIAAATAALDPARQP